MVNTKKLSEFFPLKVDQRYRDIVVSGLQIDSRLIELGDAFFAYAGEHVDGRQYAASAAAKGAVLVIAETPETPEQRAWLSELSCECLFVTGLVELLPAIAAEFYERPSAAMNVVAVTGTNGKTSVSHVLAQMYEQCQGRRPGLMGTLGNGRFGHLVESPNTTMNALDLQKTLAELCVQDCTDVVMEASSHGLALGRLNHTDINIAVVTNISRDHLDFHGDMERYQAAKALLLKWPTLQYAVLNYDDKAVRDMCALVPEGVGVKTFSIRNDENADVWVSDATYSAKGIQFILHTREQSQAMSVALVGSFNLANCVAVCAVMLAQGFSLSDISTALLNVLPVKGRMEMLPQQQVQLPTVVIDFAHTPDALQHALTTLKPHCTGALWCVFGCGGDRDTGKRPMMGSVAYQHANHMVVTADNPRSECAEAICVDIQADLPKTEKVKVILDRAEAVSHAIDLAKSDDWILIAGKGHENYQEISGVKHSYSDHHVATQALLQKANRGMML